jgi:hypothetical protein
MHIHSTSTLRNCNMIKFGYNFFEDLDNVEYLYVPVLELLLGVTAADDVACRAEICPRTT